MTLYKSINRVRIYIWTMLTHRRIIVASGVCEVDDHAYSLTIVMDTVDQVVHCELVNGVFYSGVYVLLGWVWGEGLLGEGGCWEGTSGGRIDVAMERWEG